MTRTAADVGAGLAPVRDARPIIPGERIHVVGIAGAGASAAALLAQAAGAIVTGCDPGTPSPYTPALVAAGINVAAAHDAAHVTGPGTRPDRLAVSKALTAIDPDHPELAAARTAGIPVEPWQQVVADSAVGLRLIAVAGTHGKSTVAGWLTHVLAAAGRDPSAFVGALLPPTVTGGVAATARLGRGAEFVVEADEYAGNFDAYRPSIAILTSVEWDHPDVFRDAEAVQAAFEGWIRRMPAGSILVANAADAGVRAVLDALGPARPARLMAYGLAADPAAGLPPTIRGRITDAGTDGTVLEISGLGADGGTVAVRLPTYGVHNAANALAVAAAASALGLDVDAITAGLASFGGIGRRLERKGDAAGVAVYDDYGHHPTAIRATIAALRQREADGRLWAVYEPLTFHRTAALRDEFAAALATADAVAVADIWAGRDPDTSIASAADLAAVVAALRPGVPVAAPGSIEATAEWLATQVRAGDVVLVMGGGLSYRIGDLLLERLRAERR